MGIFKQTYRFAAGRVLGNPTTTASVLVFGLGFALVAGNAIYSQPQVHPDPFWQTTDKTVTRSLVETVRVESAPVSITRSVLTQRISLRNIPVPTASPVRKVNNASQSEIVRELQEALASLDLYKGKVDGISGSGTKTAIVAYQQSAGLLPDGVASYELLAGVHATISAAQRQAQQAPIAAPRVQNVVTGPAPKVAEFDRDMVLRIQTGLKEKFGEADITLDGVFGGQTKSAIKRFQQFFELTPSGEIDHKTLEKLMSAGIIQAI